MFNNINKQDAEVLSHLIFIAEMEREVERLIDEYNSMPLTGDFERDYDLAADAYERNIEVEWERRYVSIYDLAHCNLPMHTYDNVHECKCGKTAADVCRNCGTWECYDLPGCAEA